MYLVDHHPGIAPGPRRATPSRLAGWMSRGLAAAWGAGLERPVLDGDALVARAIRAERLDDFGADHWRAPFQVLLRSLATEADLNPLGQTMAFGQIVKTLRERLRVHDLWRRHPEILDRPVPAPVVVLGNMRSGTTRVQRLLACDRRLGHTRLFESFNPVGGSARARRLGAGAALGLLHALNPALRAIHPTGADAPEEEVGLFGLAFAGAHFETQWRIPGFARWWEAHDPGPVYRELRALLQTIGWLRGEEPRPWVLKVPQFTEELAALLAVFPDARLICLHRDPVSVVSSSCSLVWEQHRVQTDSADPRWIGREWLAKAARRQRIADAVRSTRPDVAQLDVRFDAMNRDWRGEMGRVYAMLDMALPPEVERAMARYVDGARGHHGHRHTPEQFGLTPAEIRRAMPG